MWTDFMRRLSHEEQIVVVDKVNHGASVSNYQMEQTVDRTIRQVEFEKLEEEIIILRDRAKLADKYYKTTLEQAKEIGKLEQRIAELERRLEKDATNANTGHIANVG